MPKDIEWHFIGHLQTNKVKYIVPFVSLIHSVDSEKLLSVIESEAAKCDRVSDCLLEITWRKRIVNMALRLILAGNCYKAVPSEKYPHVRICGLMGMATQTDDEDCIEREFGALKKLFDEVKGSSAVDSSAFCELSMGMSHDYPLALRHGSTLVRRERLYSGNVFIHVLNDNLNVSFESFYAQKTCCYRIC